MPNIILEFLPEYSPNYNLIELVWHSAKEYIAHRLFESVSQLEELLNKLLNEGGLIIKWERNTPVESTTTCTALSLAMTPRVIALGKMDKVEHSANMLISLLKKIGEHNS